MAAADVIKTKKIGIIGCGNLGQAVMKAFIDSGLVQASSVFITNTRFEKSEKLAREYGVNPVATNEELVEKCDVVILGVKPQDLYQTIEPIASVFHEDHIVMSLAAGVTIEALRSLIPDCPNHIRVMPNTAARVKKSVIAYSTSHTAQSQVPWVEMLLSTMGYVVAVEDGDEMQALVVSSSSGIGFVFELMIYWKEWLEERGIEPDTAKKITVQTFLGAAKLAEEASQTGLEELQRKVTSAKGVTAAGLNSIRELEIERALRYSFEKAALRDKELGESWQKNDKNRG
jgi:pyrroline-5-carboxylate reductase